MNNSQSNNYQHHECCFCNYFQLQGYRWGYCELLNVRVKGNLDACHAYMPPFTSCENNRVVGK